MDGRELLTRLCGAIDAHRWDDLAALLHEDFVCRLVHTGEVFDRDAWVRLNADYPGFERMVLQDLVAEGDRAVARCHVTGRTDGRLEEFGVATFITAEGGLIREMTEVWADVGQAPPAQARPREG